MPKMVNGHTIAKTPQWILDLYVGDPNRPREPRPVQNHEGPLLEIKGDELILGGDSELADLINDPFAYRKSRWFRLASAE